MRKTGLCRGCSFGIGAKVSASSRCASPAPCLLACLELSRCPVSLICAQTSSSDSTRSSSIRQAPHLSSWSHQPPMLAAGTEFQSGISIGLSRLVLSATMTWICNRPVLVSVSCRTHRIQQQWRTQCITHPQDKSAT